MSSWLDRIGAGLVLESPEMMDYDWDPPELVGRDGELLQLASMFAGLESPSGSGRALITGPVGSGKSVLSRIFVRDFGRHLADRRSMRWLHINCRNHPSESQVMQRILHTLDPGHPSRGLGVGEVLGSVRRLLQRESSHLMVVLDEVDHLLRRSGDDLIYRLLRIDEDQDTSGTLSLIMVSQEQILDLFEGAVISRFGRSRHLRLERYDRAGLYAIASQRAEMAMVSGSIGDDVLQLIAEAAEPSGDARVVIDLLDAAAKTAERLGRRQVVAEDVQQYSSALPASSNEDMLDTLSPHAMLLLMAICRRLRSQAEVNSGDAIMIYKVICEEYEQEPRQHTTLWKYLKSYEEMQILSSRMGAMKSGRGRSQHFSMPHHLPADVEKRLQVLVNATLRR